MRCNDLQILQVRATMAAFPGEPPPAKYIHVFACCCGACHTPLILQYPAYVRFWKHTSDAEQTSSLSKRYCSGERGSVYLVPATQIFNSRHRASTGPSETTQLSQALGHLVVRLIAFGPDQNRATLLISCDSSKYASAPSSYHDARMHSCFQTTAC